MFRFSTCLLRQILAGLLDQYTLAGSDQAFSMMKWMVEYFYKRVQNVISNYTIERHYLSLNEETGGMNDVLYKLYAITVSNSIKCLQYSFYTTFILLGYCLLLLSACNIVNVGF